MCYCTPGIRTPYCLNCPPAMQRTIDDLEAWKVAQLVVESQWDVQAVGRLIGCELGTDIRPQIQPAIEYLVGRVLQLERTAADERARIVRGEFSQICGYCGWESEVGDWAELQRHIRECDAHPLTILLAASRDVAENTSNRLMSSRMSDLRDVIRAILKVSNG